MFLCYLIPPPLLKEHVLWARIIIEALRELQRRERKKGEGGREREREKGDHEGRVSGSASEAQGRPAVLARPLALVI